MYDIASSRRGFKRQGIFEILNKMLLFLLWYVTAILFQTPVHLIWDLNSFHAMKLSIISCINLFVIHNFKMTIRHLLLCELNWLYFKIISKCDLNAYINSCEYWRHCEVARTNKTLKRMWPPWFKPVMDIFWTVLLEFKSKPTPDW